MKDAIKKYLEEQIKKDNALKECYDEKKLDRCISYIVDCARKQLKNKNGAVEDTVVYKWARDFYLGDIDNSVFIPSEPSENDEVEELDEQPKVKAPKKTKSEATKAFNEQWLFDDME